jgi:hypothetical protein
MRQKSLQIAFEEKERRELAADHFRFKLIVNGTI